MVASLLRVLHGGIQDSRLLPPKGRPNIELYSKVLIRAGRFTTQWVRLDFDTRPAFGTKSVLTIPRKGHLVSRLYLVTTMPDIETVQAQAQAAAATEFLGPKFTWTNSLGHALIQQAQIDIGGARVEVIDGQLLEVLDEFYTPLEKVELMNRLLKRNSTNFPQFHSGVAGQPTVAITPLPFWFSRGDPGVHLPIDALVADPVKLTISFNPINSLYVSSARSATPVSQMSLPGDGYFPLAGSPFYKADPVAGTPIPGLTGDPTVAPKAIPITGFNLPTAFTPGDTYILAEYIYLDAPEANRFRISDIEVPVTQHYAFDPLDTKAASRAYIPLKIPNPTRNLFFYAQRYEAPFYNAPFLATRDLSGADASGVPWWPNAAPISARSPALLRPAFVFRDSEPLSAILFEYEGKYARYETTAPSLFRSFMPSYEMKKAPFIHRYYYTLHFGLNHGHLPPSQPCGEANMDKFVNINLQLQFKPFRGSPNPNNVPRYRVYCWAETYNMFRVYAGRGGMLFGY